MFAVRTIVILFLCIFPVGVWADTHVCADCERATVAAMIADGDVTTGDTITIPAGSCEWSSGVTVPDEKKLIIVGSGSTTITSTTNAAIFELGRSGSEISNIHLIMTSGESAHGINVSGQGWLIHNMILESTNGDCYGVFAYGSDDNMDLRGVIYLNTFIETAVLVSGNLDMDVGSQSPAWYTSSSIGTEYNIFVEGNEFQLTEGNCIDANYGGKYVFRYNTSNVYIEAHSVQGDYRGARSWEIYNNQINGPVYMAFLRGGTGVMFNNTSSYLGDAPVIALDNVRSFQSRGTYAGQCDGDSTFDMNDDATGWPCRDQIGRGKDATEWSDPEVQGPDQSSEPAYFWNNTVLGGGTATISVVNNCGDWIQLNRDYFASAKSGYTAYQCPHPATGLTGTCDPNVAGVSGYNLSSGITGIGSGGSATTGGSGTITLTSP